MCTPLSAFLPKKQKTKTWALGRAFHLRILSKADAKSRWFCWGLLRFLVLIRRNRAGSSPDVRLCCGGIYQMSGSIERDRVTGALQTLTHAVRREPAMVKERRRVSQANVFWELPEQNQEAEQNGFAKKREPENKSGVFVSWRWRQT